MLCSGRIGRNADGKEAEPASNEGGEKSAQNEGNKPELHFSDLEKAMKSSGRDVLIKTLEQGYKPVGRNTIEAPDGTKYVITNKAYKTFEKDYWNTSLAFSSGVCGLRFMDSLLVRYILLKT